jgi:hypothetical protein
LKGVIDMVDYKGIEDNIKVWQDEIKGYEESIDVLKASRPDIDVGFLTDKIATLNKKIEYGQFHLEMRDKAYEVLKDCQDLCLTIMEGQTVEFNKAEELKERIVRCQQHFRNHQQ